MNRRRVSGARPGRGGRLDDIVDAELGSDAGGEKVVSPLITAVWAFVQARAGLAFGELSQDTVQLRPSCFVVLAGTFRAVLHLDICLPV